MWVHKMVLAAAITTLAMAGAPIEVRADDPITEHPDINPVAACRALLERAHENPNAAYALATIHLREEGIKRAPRIALMLFKAASDIGHEQSILEVGRLLMDIGHPIYALTWYIQAERSGHEIPDGEVAMIYNRLSPNDISEAEERAAVSPDLVLPPHFTTYDRSQPFCESSD